MKLTTAAFLGIFFLRAASALCPHHRGAAPMPELDAKGALLVAVWVLLNLLLNFFNKWALSPMVVELPCGKQGRTWPGCQRGPSG